MAHLATLKVDACWSARPSKLSLVVCDSLLTSKVKERFGAGVMSARGGKRGVSEWALHNVATKTLPSHSIAVLSIAEEASKGLLI